MSTSPPMAEAVNRRPAGVVLDAVLERVAYADEETDYTIARVATDRSGTDLLTMVGPLQRRARHLAQDEAWLSFRKAPAGIGLETAATGLSARALKGLASPLGVLTAKGTRMIYVCLAGR